MNIILSGPGRSGTTLFNHLFCYHKDFAWISGLVNKYPYLPALSIFNFVYQNNVLDINWSKVKYVPKPAEAYNYWEYFFKSFESGENDFSVKEINKVKKNIKWIKSFSRKSHFVTKITGDTRFQILNQIFDENLIYLWIERDPRVIVSSFIKQKWGFKNKLKEFEKLSIEDKIHIYSNRYLNYYKQSKQIKKHLLFYEDLCDNKISFFTELFGDLNIDFNEDQYKIISNWNIEKVTWKDHYKNQYSSKSSSLLENLLKVPLIDYNYI